MVVDRCIRWRCRRLLLVGVVAFWSLLIVFACSVYAVGATAYNVLVLFFCV